MYNIRIGNGYDVHAFSENRDLILGGVKIPYHKGLLGHSDADVLVHSIMDALLGAASMGDIGKVFPDDDNKYKGISSISLLKDIFKLLSSKKWIIINIDSVIICQEPKVGPFIQKMKANISKVLDNLELDRIGIKATTTEKLGFAGRKEGIACQAVALISKI